MLLLLDTCLVSEFTRRVPNPGVVQWVSSADEACLFLSAISVGEIQRGVARLPESERRMALTVWLNDQLLPRFAGRIFPLDANMLLLWGHMVARMEAQGRPMPIFDSLIAATCLYHSLVLVSRNVSDFEPAGMPVINPWQ